MRQEWQGHQEFIERLEEHGLASRHPREGPQSVIVYLNTNCIIYRVESHLDWCPKVFARITGST